MQTDLFARNVGGHALRPLWIVRGRGIIQLGYIELHKHPLHSTRLYPKRPADQQPEDGWAEERALNAREIVLPPRTSYTVYIDYPLEHPLHVRLRTGASGMTRSQLVDEILLVYRRIYKEENRLSTVPAYVPGQLMLNRRHTNGPYGIWGHDLGDLVLRAADVDHIARSICLRIDS